MTLEQIPPRPSYIVGKHDYVRYCGRAVRLALGLRPRVVYASDPLAALPGILAAKAAGGRLVYHEHDSPNREGNLHPGVRWARRRALAKASVIVFPNGERARLDAAETGFDTKKLHVVWNTPRLDELPELPRERPGPFVVYYHGSINPDRVPETILEAVASFNGTVRVDMAGYEAPFAKGYVRYLLSRGNRPYQEIIRYLGEQQHVDLLRSAAKCHVGLALMPIESGDVNMVHMVGASNKAFDYMAAGLALIVSDLPGWRETFVDPGYGRACDPSRVGSVRDAICRFVESPDEAVAMSERCRAKIEHDWNYNAQFGRVLAEVSQYAPNDGRL
jgi:glycosyltransferase involved in cell wall biosynthesis